MKSVPTECPRCESVQKFVPRKRDFESKRTGYKWQEVFIACNMCGYERILYPTTKELEEKKKYIYDLGRKAQYQIDTSGYMSGQISQALREARKERATLYEDLFSKVKESFGGMSPYQ